MNTLHTERLTLREFTFDDDGFILELLNDPGFLRYIGDKGVRTRSDAREYLQQGPMQSYRQNGFGLYAVCVNAAGAAAAPVGMCGLVKREGLDEPDIGFAFLAAQRGHGYAFESAAAILEHGRGVLNLPRILAITSPDNWSSIRVLEKIGLRLERVMRLSEDSKEVKLFGSAAAREST